MDFEDTDEEAVFRKKAIDWLSDNADLLDPEATPDVMLGERVDGETVARCKAWQAMKADAGWACLTWPKEFGGQNLSPILAVIFRQEESKFSIPPDIYTIGIGMLGPTLMAHGSDEQKARFLPPMRRGDEVWCQLFSEPAAGSDLAGLRSTATRENDDWILNGQKTWSTGAHFCDLGMIVVRTDSEAVKHAGLTYFIVDMKSPGVEVRPIRQINGATGFNEVFFNDVKLSDSNRVGDIGDGWRVALTTLMNERVAIGPGGASQRVRDLIALARDVKRGSGPAIEDSSVRQRLADFYITSKGLQNIGFRTLSALSRGVPPGPEGSVGKAVGAPMAQEMAAFALELMGPAATSMEAGGVSQKTFWQESFLASAGMRIAGGTDEVLKNIIAERILRLPPEIRVDKDKPFRDVPANPPGN